MINYKGWVKVLDLDRTDNFKYKDYEAFLESRGYFYAYKSNMELYNTASSENAKRGYKEYLEELDRKNLEELNYQISHHAFQYIYIKPEKYEAYKVEFARKYPHSELGKEYRMKMAGLYLV